jgi:hypothetical protein
MASNASARMMSGRIEEPVKARLADFTVVVTDELGSLAEALPTDATGRLNEVPSTDGGAVVEVVPFCIVVDVLLPFCIVVDVLLPFCIVVDVLVAPWVVVDVLLPGTVVDEPGGQVVVVVGAMVVEVHGHFGFVVVVVDEVDVDEVDVDEDDVEVPGFVVVVVDEVDEVVVVEVGGGGGGFLPPFTQVEHDMDQALPSLVPISTTRYWPSGTESGMVIVTFPDAGYGPDQRLYDGPTLTGTSTSQVVGLLRRVDMSVQVSV